MFQFYYFLRRGELFPRKLLLRKYYLRKLLLRIFYLRKLSLRKLSLRNFCSLFAAVVNVYLCQCLPGCNN